MRRVMLVTLGSPGCARDSMAFRGGCITSAEAPQQQGLCPGTFAVGDHGQRPVLLRCGERSDLFGQSVVSGFFEGRICLGCHGYQVLVDLQEISDGPQRRAEVPETRRDRRLGVGYGVLFVLAATGLPAGQAKYSSRRSPAARLDLPGPVPVGGDPLGTLRRWLGQRQVKDGDRLVLSVAGAVRDDPGLCLGDAV